MWAFEGLLAADLKLARVQDQSGKLEIEAFVAMSSLEIKCLRLQRAECGLKC